MIYVNSAEDHGEYRKSDPEICDFSTDFSGSKNRFSKKIFSFFKSSILSVTTYKYRFFQYFYYLSMRISPKLKPRMSHAKILNDAKLDNLPPDLPTVQYEKTFYRFHRPNHRLICVWLWYRWLTWFSYWIFSIACPSIWSAFSAISRRTIASWRASLSVSSLRSALTWRQPASEK